ncbi:MAG: hypothetical protein WC962_04425 [Phycisphaerae bacterium]|jgi:hypothetical protein
MRGLRGKFILLLIVYLAGFATAIYVTVPVESDQSEGVTQAGQNFSWSDFKSDQFAQRFSVELHRCVDFMKEKGCQAGEYLKVKYEEYQESR